MKRLARIIQDYFGFSVTELRGFWVLLVLAVILLAVPPATKQLYLQTSTSSFPANPAKLDSLIALLESTTSENNFRNRTSKDKVNYAVFNPNNASRGLLIQNGIPTWLADRIIKYRSKGGTFRKKSDLLKIYGFPKELYSHLENYLEVPQKVSYKSRKNIAASVTSYPNARNKNYYPKKNKELIAFDINQADSSQLMEVPGIGSVLSARIIRFRDRLGGLYSKQQYLEVYHISEEATHNLQKYTYISPEYEVSRLRVNTDEVSVLAKHPYVSYKLARAIVEHRKSYGDFFNIEDCQEVYLMNDSIFQKIAPYLEL